MSSILDALKKSDERYKGRGSPSLRMMHPRVMKESGKGTRLMYLLTFALIFSAVLLLWRLGPWRSGEDVNQAKGPASSPRAAALTHSATFSEKADAGVSQETKAGKIVQGNGNRQVVPHALGVNQEKNIKPILASAGLSADEEIPLKFRGLPAFRKHRSEATGIANYSRSPARVPVSGSAAWPEPSDAGKAARLPARAATTGDGGKKADAALETSSDGKVAPIQPLGFHEVPSKVRDSIPMSISVLVYSKQPEERWANINGSKVREGEKMPSGLRVEEITPDGVVFNYQGHSFHKTVKEN